MSETVILEVRETKRSYGPLWLALSVLMLGLPFLGRQRILLTNERITITQGFWTKVRDDIEIFRIRDVVVKQSLYHRLTGIGDIVIKALEGRSEEIHLLRGVADPVSVSERIREVWNRTARPAGPAATLD
ncbi:PH domain-containing protein [Roseomonas terrae]|uniref:PH domain-containing protein n=1 Tax=Neoroseomonas terrae TaxID=424799 RepID=A0ABS5EHR8_9PROT|nr:PH domain-containing protein [Neoroseomonas terrae]MBR0650559.1 PH domain-containing protein [Neoroseomonas terrae]